MTHKPRSEKKGGGWAVLAVGLVIVPVLYVASSGPALWLVSKDIINERIVLTVYAPIEWACETSDPITRAMRWYLDLWVPESVPPSPPPPPTATRA